MIIVLFFSLSSIVNCPCECILCSEFFSHDWLYTCRYSMFSLTWPVSMQIYWNKRKRLHKKRVQLPQDWFGHKHGRRFIVLGHKYGRHDVMWKHTIKLESSEPVVGFRSYWHFLLECEFKNMPISQVYRFGPSSEYFYQLLSCMFQVRRILVIFTTNLANFQNPKNWVDSYVSITFYYVPFDLIGWKWVWSTWEWN